MPAPVVVFAYSRRDHLQRTIDSLRGNREASTTDLHVYCDGPRAAADAEKVEDVRNFVRTIDGFASVRRIFREHNLGLSRSIIGGVSELLTQYEQLIVLEDDLNVSPHFLGFMNDALACYRHDQQVASVHGYCYPIDSPLDDTFFLRGADCWGWATWARAWQHFNPDGRYLLAQLRQRKLTRAFDLDGCHGFTAMLEDQVAGRNDSWAIRWHASCFLADMLTLYPGRSLVENIGNDASGTHCSDTNAFSRPPTTDVVPVRRIPLAESALARRAFSAFLRSQQQQPSSIVRARRFLSRLRRGSVA